jgi:hypothetical protein
MYILLTNAEWNNGQQYLIFGIPDIIDFSINFGTWNPFDVAIKNTKTIKYLKNTERLARVKGIKEGALRLR